MKRSIMETKISVLHPQWMVVDLRVTLTELVFRYKLSNGYVHYEHNSLTPQRLKSQTTASYPRGILDILIIIQLLVNRYNCMLSNRTASYSITNPSPSTFSMSVHHPTYLYVPIRVPSELRGKASGFRNGS
jgi:hypothetical protein